MRASPLVACLTGAKSACRPPACRRSLRLPRSSASSVRAAAWQAGRALRLPLRLLLPWTRRICPVQSLPHVTSPCPNSVTPAPIPHMHAHAPPPPTHAGVDIIEAGFPIASPDDFEAVRAIAMDVGNAVHDDGYVPVICGLSRTREKVGAGPGVVAGWGCAEVGGQAGPRLQPALLLLVLLLLLLCRLPVAELLPCPTWMMLPAR